MGDVKLRARFPSVTPGGRSVSIKASADGFLDPYTFPCKEWSITDDVLTISDSACFTIANDDGENSDKFSIGQRVELDVSDSEVAGGTFTRRLTGLITELEYGSDAQQGSIIRISSQDLGWMFTNCHGKSLQNLETVSLANLVNIGGTGRDRGILIDPTWGFAPSEAGNNLNRRAKQGRIAAERAIAGIPIGTLLPYIQIEPGQTPFDILSNYAKREGLLINVGSLGQLILFRPQYVDPALYKAIYRSNTDSDRNNMIGRPRLRKSIDGLYTDVECWSMIVDPGATPPKGDPNFGKLHSTFKPSTSPLPFKRLNAFWDAEAITGNMRQTRARWKQQMGEFQSWEYEAAFPTLSQNGTMFSSDTMITIDDTIHKISGDYYVQSVHMSQTMSEGTRSRLIIRKPKLLDPGLTVFGGGVKKS